jgi:hypothetical protein
MFRTLCHSKIAALSLLVSDLNVRVLASRVSVRPGMKKPVSLRKCTLHSKYICSAHICKIRGEKRRSWRDHGSCERAGEERMRSLEGWREGSRGRGEAWKVPVLEAWVYWKV